MGARQSRPGAPQKKEDHARNSGPCVSEGKPTSTIQIKPLEDVYSYFMFVMPIEEARAPGRFTWNKGLACSMVLATLLLQSVLLYAIFIKVVSGDVAWRDSIMGRTELWSFWGSGASKCNPGGSLCTSMNGTFTCAPPSVQLTGRWEELDVNGDGVWTREEAVEAREALRCKYVVDPLEVFSVFVALLREREKHIWLHPELRAGRAIRKAYFTYAAGDLIMCGYRSQEMCANLLQRGVFDAPLRYGTAPRVGDTIQSALDYCFGLLGPGGTCERMLPSTYSVWKKGSERQCKGPKYNQAVYTHPTTGVVKSMLTVDYQARKDYARVDKSMLFFAFKAIIIGLFLLCMYAEFSTVALHLSWACSFPSAERFRGKAVVMEGGTEEGGQGAVAILGVTRSHRLGVAFLTIARGVVLAVLTVVGVTFLQKDTDWINLLLNGVAMVFVAEIAGTLYSSVVSPSLRERCENTEPMEVPTRGLACLRKRPGVGDLLGFLALVVTVVAIMCLHFQFVGHPLSQALACACISEGPHCSEAQRFSPSFWRQYWHDDVPSVFAEVDRLRLAEGEPGGQRHRRGRRMLNP